MYAKVTLMAVRSFILIIACSILWICSEANAKNVYDNQSPLTDKELVSFIELLPQFRAWTVHFNVEAHPIVNSVGEADFVYSEDAANWVSSKNWEPKHFFSVMGRTAAALAIIGEGNDLLTRTPTDMPTVTEEELFLVRKHLGSLLKAGSSAPPLK